MMKILSYVCVILSIQLIEAETILKGVKLPGCRFEGREFEERVAMVFDVETTSEILQTCQEWIIAVNKSTDNWMDLFTAEAKLSLKVSKFNTLETCEYGADKPSLGFNSPTGVCIPLRCSVDYIRVETLAGEVTCIPANSSIAKVTVVPPLPEGGDPAMNKTLYAGFACSFGIITFCLLVVFCVCYTRLVRREMDRPEFIIPEEPAGRHVIISQAGTTEMEVVRNSFCQDPKSKTENTEKEEV